jgi:hypothetical protein
MHYQNTSDGASDNDELNFYAPSCSPNSELNTQNAARANLPWPPPNPDDEVQRITEEQLSLINMGMVGPEKEEEKGESGRKRKQAERRERGDRKEEKKDEKGKGHAVSPISSHHLHLQIHTHALLIALLFTDAFSHSPHLHFLIFHTLTSNPSIYPH